MRHNKIVGWSTFLEVVEQVQKISPWLSRQIAQRASEWPFWYSGLQVRKWEDRAARVHMPLSLRNSVDGEICHGHLLLGAELALRLVLLRYRHEFPFRYQIKSSRMELHHPVDQAVDFRFSMDTPEWERLRLELARGNSVSLEFVVPATLTDGRSALQAGFQVAFQLEKLLGA
jgi:hypothetical protein